MVSDILRQALGQHGPKLLSVLGAALGNAELIAYALDNITGLIVLTELIIEITDGAGEAHKLVAAELIELELFLILLRNDPRDRADTLNALGQADILEQLVQKLDIILNKLVKAVVSVLGDKPVYDIDASLGDAEFLSRRGRGSIAAYYLTKYREAVIDGLDRKSVGRERVF